MRKLQKSDWWIFVVVGLFGFCKASASFASGQMDDAITIFLAIPVAFFFVWLVYFISAKIDAAEQRLAQPTRLSGSQADEESKKSAGG